ncbi:PhoX family phosphatase [uncultured Thiohalocapsa sp.]|uniref:PhoX family protein n=1 Tax=uncultured Thiohalocapsa sp. TaxID=768990 RepID=UPI0025DFF6C5|nr:PhoX family phosphatase [uncultured Thiohalocapsa sp.]
MSTLDHAKLDPVADPDDIPVNPATEPSLDDLIQRRFGRRDLLRGALGALAAGPLAGLAAGTAAAATAEPLGPASSSPDDPTRFDFPEIPRGVDATHHVAPGYSAQVLIRWGDPLLPGAPPFDPQRPNAAAQRRQFGYNNDFIGYIPLPLGSSNSEHGLLCVNHEYTNTGLMFPGLADAEDPAAALTGAMVDTELAAHGGSIVEIHKAGGQWHLVPGSRFNRRIEALTTPIRLSGPAAGHPRLRTRADPTGTRVIGTLNNCAGGITPWGTYLMAEENFHLYFAGSLDGHPEQRNYARCGMPAARYAWARHHRRFDLNAEPNEANRFGWVVEVDPFDPQAMPVKRTALGRFKHEGAECIVNGDGRLVIYSGDDQRFEFLYKFVTAGTVTPLPNPASAPAEASYVGRIDAGGQVHFRKQDMRRRIAAARAANRDLLDQGTLFVARLGDDGGLQWLPLVHGHGPLTAANGFDSQADVLIETRRAATLLGATPMDRPEDVEPNPLTGKVYVSLTNNKNRGKDGYPDTDPANPRTGNLWGQVLEITPQDGDHAADTATWDLLVRAGDPTDPAVAAHWNPATSADGWFACPDNCAVDPSGRLWVATDQGGGWPVTSGGADGIYALETEGPGRGTARCFFRVPVGAEMCGPRFTPDGRTLFVAVQHPGADGTEAYPGFERKSTFEDPATRWPDFADGIPPRPSVLAITRNDGGVIGG